MKKKTQAKSSRASKAPSTDAVGLAHALGATLGLAAAKTETLAKEIATVAQALGKRTAATSRQVFKRAQKSLSLQKPHINSRRKKQGLKKSQGTKKTLHPK